jgi:hypothetical protein
LKKVQVSNFLQYKKMKPGKSNNFGDDYRLRYNGCLIPERPLTPMDTSSAQPHNFIARLNRLAVAIWLGLSRPQTTLILLIAVGVVLLAGWLIPQAAANTSAQSWIATLPPAVQLWGEPLYLLGLANIFNSVWWWGLLALLLLNSLIAVAEFAPPSWRRARELSPGLEWQHPLARRVEHSVRLTATPVEDMATVEDRLRGAGFAIDPAPEETGRLISAARHRRMWPVVAVFYAGVLLLGTAFLLTHLTLKTEALTLWPHRSSQSSLFPGEVTLGPVDAAGGSAQVTFFPADPAEPAWEFVLAPFVPAFYRQSLLWPSAIEPVLTITATDADGELRRLMPVQAELSPETHLSLPRQSEAPLYFLIPSANLAFQITPDATGYAVQVRHSQQNTVLRDFEASPGDEFEVNNLRVALEENYKLSLLARRDFGLPLYALSLLAMLISAALLLLFPPWQVWLIPDVRGRGGQLYGVTETLASGHRAESGLAEWLSLEGAPDEPLDMDDNELSDDDEE